MRRPLRALTLMILLLEGCGGGGSDLAAAGFINQTGHTDAELWALWRAAQQNLSQQIDLNPLQRADQCSGADSSGGCAGVECIAAAACGFVAAGRLRSLRRQA